MNITCDGSFWTDCSPSCVLEKCDFCLSQLLHLHNTYQYFVCFCFFPVLHWVVPFRMCGADNQTERQMVNKTKRNWDWSNFTNVFNKSVESVYPHHSSFMLCRYCPRCSQDRKRKWEQMVVLERNTDSDQMENEKNISSLVTRTFCFSSSLTFGAF